MTTKTAAAFDAAVARRDRAEAALAAAEAAIGDTRGTPELWAAFDAARAERDAALLAVKVAHAATIEEFHGSLPEIE